MTGELGGGGGETEEAALPPFPPPPLPPPLPPPPPLLLLPPPGWSEGEGGRGEAPGEGGRRGEGGRASEEGPGTRAVKSVRMFMLGDSVMSHKQNVPSTKAATTVVGRRGEMEREMMGAGVSRILEVRGNKD